MGHGAMHAVKTDALAEVFIGCLMYCFLEQWKRFVAIATLSKGEGLLCVRCSGG
jgi:hypothetical protein